ncbi:MAG: SIS domain-containing protein [Erysipelotrichaceae bacterium]|nr:SIS domain-containing protein [Erysipelotrichaceae bacterium]
MLYNREENYWKEKDAIYTASEIAQEPRMWLKTRDIVKQNKERINTVLDELFKDDEYDVVLTGAGTSEFVGNSIYNYLNTLLDFHVRSIGTTDIVASPASYLNPKRRTLMISFARSGNSPESVAAVHCANTVCSDIRHIFVTCNKDGALNKIQNELDNAFSLNMPDETNDLSFAMTSSYSCMYLATVLMFMQYKGLAFDSIVEELAENGQKFLDEKAAYVEEIVESFPYNRVVYLGSNDLKGVSQESALKTCELTAGNIMTTFDTTMGFRHGPKSVVKDDSLIVVYVSDDEYTRQYDRDIVREISGDGVGKLLVLSSHEDEELASLADYFVSIGNKTRYPNVFLGLEYVLTGQLLGLFKSLNGGNTPDNPCSSGQVFRVVRGVTIYPYER